MHKKEIMKLMGTMKKGGYTLVPISLYFKDGRAKVEIGLARGKKSHDKRQDLLAKEASREAQRAVSRRSSGKDY
jgi:SsrA-binding protein